jgi:hypothetical protein
VSGTPYDQNGYAVGWQPLGVWGQYLQNLNSRYPAPA